MKAEDKDLVSGCALKSLIFLLICFGMAFTANVIANYISSVENRIKTLEQKCK